jgi:lipoyl-dependent peroxiredoxin
MRFRIYRQQICGGFNENQSERFSRLAGRNQGRQGSISTESGALKAYPYGFASRFEGMPGTNPEELIAAAHAGCFTMALSLILSEAKLTAELMETSAKVTLEQVEGGSPSQPSI